MDNRRALCCLSHHQRSGRSKFVWLSENWKDYFEAVPVKAGIATLERVEIVSGLKDGDRVATK